MPFLCRKKLCVVPRCAQILGSFLYKADILLHLKQLLDREPFGNTREKQYMRSSINMGIR